jgi:hypothetical protein
MSRKMNDLRIKYNESNNPFNIQARCCAVWDIDSVTKVTIRENILWRIDLARQRLGKHIPAEADSRNNRASITRQRIIKDAFLTIEAAFFAWPVRSGYKKGLDEKSLLSEVERVHLSELSRIGSSSGNGSRRWLRRNCEKGIRPCKEVFMCDLKSQWDSYKSVARIRLMKTENPSACATVNWKCVNQR